MINSLLLSEQPQRLSLLEKCGYPIGFRFSNLQILKNQELLLKHIKTYSIKLLIIDSTSPRLNLQDLIPNLENMACESLIIFQSEESLQFVKEAGILGCSLCPYEQDSLTLAFQHLLRKIYKFRNPGAPQVYPRRKDEIFGIPTFNGYDFINISHIVRCEGLQRCTRIVMLEGNSLTSSHNLGVFIDKLRPYGFFSPHKSHLINLQFIKQYERIGNLVMCDGSNIPVSRRKKQDLLSRLHRI